MQFSGRVPPILLSISTPQEQQTRKLSAFSGNQTGHCQVDSQAYLCQCTAALAVNLYPPGIEQSEFFAVSTNGTQQVGYGIVDPTQGLNHAMVWSGTAASMADLQLLLPQSGTWNFSWAFSIDANGIIYGAANGTYDGITGTFATEWTPLPEPSMISFFAIAGISLSRRAKSLRPH